jgi:hypothetical protein
MYGEMGKNYAPSEAFFPNSKILSLFYHIELISSVSLSMRWDDLLIDVGFA